MLLKNNTSKVLRNFLNYPRRKYSLREVSRMSKVSTTAAKKALDSLIKEDIIKKSVERLSPVYSAKAESEEFKGQKKFHMLYMLRSSGVLEFLDEKLHRPEAVILFGSAARGEDVEESDIDLFALVAEKKEIDLGRFEKVLKKRISLMQMTRKEFTHAKKKSPELVNNIANGIILKGYLEVV